MNQAFDKGFRAGMNTVSPAANPYSYKKHPHEFFDWAQGRWEGHEIRNKIMAAEHKLYRTADPARFQMLWG
jgi:hypothetical protein